MSFTSEGDEDEEGEGEGEGEPCWRPPVVVRYARCLGAAAQR